MGNWSGFCDCMLAILLGVWRRNMMVCVKHHCMEWMVFNITTSFSYTDYWQSNNWWWSKSETTISSFFSISSQFIYSFTQNVNVALTVCIIGGVAPLSLSSMLSRYNVSCIGNMMMDEVWMKTRWRERQC